MSKTHAAKSAAVPAFPTGKPAPHKLASLVPGEMSKEEYAALCTSIKEDGLRNAIMIFEDQILDGRHRYSACVDTGVKPRFEQFKGDAQDAARYSLDQNLHRRTLNSMQKAVVAARMHLDAVAGSPVTQKDSAARVGVGVATVALAVRLINSKNTPLIKRCENGDATRAEIDELLFDRATAQAAEAVLPAVDGEDELGTGAAPGNVVELDSRRPAVAGKVSHPERRAQETSVSRVVQHFKGLTEKERVAFVNVAWPWLGPAISKAKPAEHVRPVVDKPIGRDKPAAIKRGLKKAIKASNKVLAKAKAAAAKVDPAAT